MRLDQRVLRVLGVDFHILQTLMQRLWMTLAGAAMVVLVPLFLGPVEQGYYFTFASILALQIFFELGLNYVVTQIVGHEVSHLEVGPGGALSGDAARISRLASLVQLVTRWYRVASALFFVIVSVAGTLFFAGQGDLPFSDWLGVWLALSAMASINLLFSPMLAILEGAGQVGQVARLRLWQSVAGYGLMWVALAAGLGLWAIVALPAMMALFTGVWLHRTPSLVKALKPGLIDPSNVMSWRSEILPFQWRIGLSWVSGYFILQLFTPLAFAHQGADEAGRVGLALLIFTSLQTLGMSWTNARVPWMAGAIAQGRREELNAIFKAASLRSIAFVALGSVGVLAAVALARGWDLELAARVADFPILVLFAVATTANTAVYAAAAYMRAHREEPMLTPSVVLGVITLVGVYTVSAYGPLATVAVYAGLSVFVSLPWTAALFSSYARRTA